MTKRLPELIDHAGIMRELGVKRTTADAIMKRCEKVIFPDTQKVWVKRADVDKLVAESTHHVRLERPLRSVA